MSQQQVLPDSQLHQHKSNDLPLPLSQKETAAIITKPTTLLKVDTELSCASSSTSARPTLTPPAVSTSRPDSPFSRKRTENIDNLDPCNDHSSARESSQDRHPPPFKKSKKSPPPLLLSPRLSQTNMSEYRSSQEQPFSPQTSPIADEFLEEDDTGPPPSRDIYRPALLVRARTLEEIRHVLPPPPLSRHASSILDSMAKSSETAIGNLTLGSNSLPSGSGRTHLAERSMGVITSNPSSRQGSPAILLKSRESTPLSIEDEQQHLHANSSSQHSGFPRRYPSHDVESSPCPSDNTSSSDETRNLAELLADTVATYRSDLDEDYFLEPDTTVDEHDSRIDALSCDDDSFTEIDTNNIFIPNPHAIEPLFSSGGLHGPNDSIGGEISEEQTYEILEEARAYGVEYIIEQYILQDIFTTRQLLAAFNPSLDTDGEEWSERRLMLKLTEVIIIALRRKRLTNISTLEKVVELLQTSKRIMILTGAGVSVSCGIPDFRSPNGVYSRLQEFNLKDPQQMFDLAFFKRRPEIFYSFAKEIFPSNFVPSPSHNFIKLIEDKGKLLRNYTQNIDTLEQQAGIERVIQCHGSFATASCLRCGRQVPGDNIKDSIFKQEVAYCTECPPPSPSDPIPRTKEAYYSSDEESDSNDELDDTPPPPLMKPDITFFGEKLTSAFRDHMEQDRDQVDLLIVMGTSLEVAPVNSIVDALPAHVPQILINKTTLPHVDFDVQLLGDSDIIVAELSRMIGWRLSEGPLSQEEPAPWQYVEPCTYVFEGGILEADFSQSPSP